MALENIALNHLMQSFASTNPWPGNIIVCSSWFT